MKQRITFGLREKRRDQRRPISLEGTIDGVAVHLSDVSFHGIGGGTMELRDPADLTVAEGDETTLEFTSPDGHQMRLRITIRRIDREAGTFGATFQGLSDAQFDAIERMMFPRLHAAKT